MIQSLAGCNVASAAGDEISRLSTVFGIKEKGQNIFPLILKKV